MPRCAGDAPRAALAHPFSSDARGVSGVYPERTQARPMAAGEIADRPSGGVAMTTRERIFVDSTGTEWEVFDEGEWNASLALAFDLPLPGANPGLLFVSSRDMRRLWPRPDGWRDVDDEELEEWCGRAVSLY